MRKLSLFVMAAALTCFVAAGCGGGGTAATDGGPKVDGKKVDAKKPTDGAKPVDGKKPTDGAKPVDGKKPTDGTKPPTDGGRGNKEQFDDCAKDADCIAGLNCRSVAWFDGQKVCLKPCTASSECDFDLFCYPDNVPSNFAPMKKHCFFSLCGGDMNNGDLLKACKMGAEMGVTDGANGTCYPIDDPGSRGAEKGFGQCVEAGNVAAGGVCDFSNTTRGGKNCAQGSLCFGQRGATEGTCMALCNPVAATDECAGSAGKACLDLSDAETREDPDTGKPVERRATMGICDDGKGCDLLKSVADNACPQDQGCAPTNPLHSKGWCDPSGYGKKNPGEACTERQSGDPPAPDTDCMQSLCGADTAGGPTTCHAYCDPKATPGTCTAPNTCQVILWSAADPTEGTLDQNTIGWGLCGPAAP